MTLKTAIKSRKIAEIRKITKETPIADIADMLEELSLHDRVLFFRLLKTDTQSEIFVFLEPEFQEELIKAFTDEEVKNISDDLFADELADLIEEVPSTLANRILKNTSKETRSDVNRILRYSPDQTGSVMVVDIATFKQTLSVKEAIEQLKASKSDIELVHYFFVVDSKNRLVGYIAIEDLLFSPGSAKVKSLTKPVGYVYTTTDKEEAALEFADQNMSVLPVINKSKEVIGMITADDVIDIVQEAATEDMQKMAGIEVDSVSTYSKTSIRKIFRSRVFWILLLMISATLSQIVLDAFQNIASIDLAVAGAGITSAIIAILPVISGAAGNAGSQASTTVIRALATGDITVKDYFKVFKKEFQVSTLIGISLAVANFLRLVIYYSVKGNIDDPHYLFLSLAASISLFVVIILAKVVGGMLPLLAKVIKLDPAVMAAPLLTTLIDALSTLIFFGISIGIMVLVI